MVHENSPGFQQLNVSEKDKWNSKKCKIFSILITNKVNGIGKRVNEIKPKVMSYKLKFADSARLWHDH